MISGIFAVFPRNSDTLFPDPKDSYLWSIWNSQPEPSSGSQSGSENWTGCEHGVGFLRAEETHSGDSSPASSRALWHLHE